MVLLSAKLDGAEQCPNKLDGLANDFHMLLSQRISELKMNRYINDAFVTYADKPIRIPTKFVPDFAFLKYHRENLFCG